MDGRRGLHGGVLAFYDEAREWPAMQEATADAAAALAAAGCVPYKSGKLWSRQVRSAEGYFHLLELIKRGVDPHGVLARGNLGLG